MAGLEQVENDAIRRNAALVQESFELHREYVWRTYWLSLGIDPDSFEKVATKASQEK